LRCRSSFTGARIGQPQGWYAFASGHSGITYNGGFAGGGRARAEVYLQGGTQDENLHASKSDIETAFRESLVWERLDGRRASRVVVYRSGSIEDDSETLDEIRTWMIERLLQIKKEFGPRLEEALR